MRATARLTEAITVNIVQAEIQDLQWERQCYLRASMILILLSGIVFFSPRSINANAPMRIVYSQELEEPIELADNSNIVGRVESWQVLISKGSRMSKTEKLKTVNSFFNQLKYGDDPTVWGEKDYWSVPEEFLDKGVGDCEDYALSKYYTLIKMGVEENSLYLCCVTKLPSKASHMVLFYSTDHGSDPLVLDNIVPQIRPLSKRTDIIPIYTFNSHGVYVPQQRGGRGVFLGFKVPLAKWREYLDRVGIITTQAGSFSPN